MLDHQQPPNWVAARAACKVDLLFEALCQVVNRDVAEVNKLSSDMRGGYMFAVGYNGDGTRPLLRVYRVAETSPNDRRSIATFEQKRWDIRIQSRKDKGVVVATPWADEVGTCLLSVDGTRYRVWELSREVLAPLFFGTYVDADFYL